MPRERLNKQNKPGKEKKEGYIIIPNYFLREYIKVLGVGPAMFYQYLFTYCHKNKNTAWPSLSTSSKDTGITKKTLTKYYRILIQYGLIKKFSKKKLSSDGYMRNIYQLTPLNGEKITLHKGIFYHNIGVKITPDLGKKLPPNNTNLNITNTTAAKREKDAAVVAINFKKLKEKGEERMQAVKERMVKLDFKEEFIEKMLKEYSMQKIEEKLDLLRKRRNIKNPVGWLRAALKKDYRGEETRRIDSRFHGNDIKRNGNDIIPNVIANDRRECGNPKQVNLNFLLPSPLEGEGLPCVVEEITAQGQGEGDKILSTEDARERFKLLREKLIAMKSP